MEYLLKASAIIALFYFCYKLFLQRETFFESNRWFFLCGLIIALILPLVVIPIYIEITPKPLNPLLITPEIISDEAIPEPIKLNDVLIWVYGLGFVFFFARFIINLSSLIKLLNSNYPKKHKNYLFIETKNAIAPFSFFNWIVYNPSQFKEHELKLIINHEKVHTNQWHSIDVLISQILCIVFWFNPFAWLYKKDLQQNLEFIADKKAQYVSDCKQSYQRLLLKASIPNHQLVISNNFYNSLIKKRIVMLHKSKSKSLNAWKYLLVIPALGLFLMSFNTKEVYIIKDAINTTLTDKEFLITPKSTDGELTTIENYFSKKEMTLQFSDKIRNENGELEQLSINTKTKNNERFEKRMTISKTEEATMQSFKIGYNTPTENITFVPLKNEHNASTLSPELITFTEETTTSQFPEVPNSNSKTKPADNSLGSNPLYIIEGKAYKKSELPAQRFQTSEGIQLLNKNESRKLYGNKGKDGAIVFNGKTDFNPIHTRVNSNREMIVITKDYTEADLNLAKAQLEKEGLTIKFKGIKRNGSGEITSIKIDASSKDSKANFNLDSDDPINPIKISFDRDGNNISIGNTSNSENVFITNHGRKAKLRTRGHNGNTYYYSDNHDEDEDHDVHFSSGSAYVIKNSNSNTNDGKRIIELKSIDGKEKVIELKRDNTILFKEDDANEKVEYVIAEKPGKHSFMVYTDEGENPLILLNGKEITQEAMDKIDPESILKVEILKGENATEAHGSKGKDGVILITTKEN